MSHQHQVRWPANGFPVAGVNISAETDWWMLVISGALEHGLAIETPIVGMMIQSDEHIFSEGWLETCWNHQPDFNSEYSPINFDINVWSVGFASTDVAPAVRLLVHDFMENVGSTDGSCRFESCHFAAFCAFCKKMCVSAFFGVTLW